MTPPILIRRPGPGVVAAFVFAAAPLFTSELRAQPIQRSPEPFIDSPQLPFAPAAPAPGATRTALRTQVVHRLRSGEPIHAELQRWAEQSGWEFHWYPSRSWKTMRDALIDKSNVAEAVGEVIDILRSEGKPVQLRISDGNAVMEVLSTEVRND